MSKILSILERLGQDAETYRGDGDALKRALGDMELDGATLVALVGGDPAPLASVLGASCNVVCGLFPGKEDDEESPDEDDDEESPDRDEPGDSPDREENPNVSIRRIAVRANRR